MIASSHGAVLSTLAMLRRRRSFAESTAFACMLLAAFAALYAVLAKVALNAFPYSGDEYSLVLQAQLFAAGQLKAPAPAHAEWLRIDHVVIDQFVRSKYPLGGPALLSLGTRAGATWLVHPTAGLLALVVTWLSVRRVLGARAGLVALVALGAAPLFAFDAASFYTHIPTVLMLAIGFGVVALWVESGRDGYLVLVGWAIGCAFLIRPLDAVLFGLALLVFRSPRAVIIPAFSAVPFVVATLWYQNAQFGSPFTDGYHAYEPTFTALYGDAAMNPISWRHIISPVQWWNHIDLIGQLCTQWTLPGTVVVALFGAYAPFPSDSPGSAEVRPSSGISQGHSTPDQGVRRWIDSPGSAGVHSTPDQGVRRWIDKRASAMQRFSIALIAVVLIALIPTISDPDDGPHPRYLSTVLVPLAFLCAAGFPSMSAAIRRTFGAGIRTAIVGLGIVFGLAQLGAFLQDRIPKIWKREGLYEATASLPRDAVVIVRAQYPSRFARNGPFFDGMLYLSALPTTTAIEVAAAYPDRPIWEAREGVPWTVERVR